MLKRNKPGVYCIKNKITNKCYYGSSSKSISGRISSHKSRLKKGSHHCKYLQNSWNKWGEENFDFIVLHNCPGEYTIKLEQVYLNNFYLESYNSSPIASGNNRIRDIESIFYYFIANKDEYQKSRNLNFMKKIFGISEESVRNILSRESYNYLKISKELETEVKNILENRKPYWEGKSRSAETNKKISEKLKGKRGRKVVDTQTGVIHNTVQEASEKLNIHHETLRCYLIGKRKNKTTLKFL